MAKEIKAKLKLQIPGGGATPAPPVGSALGQYGVNIMDFVQAFNNDTSSRQGEIVPVEITIYEDNSFSYTTKTAPASYLIKKAVGLNSGSPEPHKEKVANITTSQLESIVLRRETGAAGRDGARCTHRAQLEREFSDSHAC